MQALNRVLKNPSFSKLTPLLNLFCLTLYFYNIKFIFLVNQTEVVNNSISFRKNYNDSLEKDFTNLKFNLNVNSTTKISIWIPGDLRF